jgi:hypothetical protein
MPFQKGWGNGLTNQNRLGTLPIPSQTVSDTLRYHSNGILGQKLSPLGFSRYTVQYTVFLSPKHVLPNWVHALSYIPQLIFYHWIQINLAGTNNGSRRFLSRKQFPEICYRRSQGVLDYLNLFGFLGMIYSVLYCTQASCGFFADKGLL